MKPSSTHNLSESDLAIEQALTRTVEPRQKPRRRDNPHRRAFRALVIILLLTVTAGAGYLGVAARNRLFVQTESIRMWWDIQNAFHQGREVVRASSRLAGMPTPADGFWGKFAKSLANKGETPAVEQKLSWRQLWEGYLTTYDRAAERARARNANNPRYSLDYAPIRLAIMSVWMKHTLEQHPDANDYRNEFAWPLMHFNTAVAAAGAMAMFAAVWVWRRRCDVAGTVPLDRKPTTLLPHDRAWMIALVAGLILWLNPAVLINSHGFVQWDSWILPFILAGMAFATAGKWGWAGAAWGASMGFKGQILLVMPALALIPLFRGDFIGWLKLLVGFALAWLAIGLPWLAPTPTAWLWLGTIALLAVAFAPHGYPKRMGLTWWLAVGVTTALLLGPFMNADWALGVLTIAMPLVAGIVLLPWIIPSRAWGLSVGLVLLGGLFATAYRFDGSWNWFVISYLFPGRQYEQMVMGPTANLPMLLAEFRWSLTSVLWSGTIGERAIELTLRQGLIGLHLAGCILCAAGAAVHQRRRDPAMLLAMAAPWVLAYTLLPQMHERYLTWAAAVAGVGIAVSAGWGLLHAAVAGASFSMVFLQMLRMHSGSWPTLQPTLEQLRPTIAGAMLLIAGVYLYGALARSRRSG